MKTLASLALVGLVYGSEDNEYFRPSTFKPTHGRPEITNHAIHHIPSHRNSISDYRFIPKPLSAVKNSHAAQFEDEELFELPKFFGKVGKLMSNDKTRTKNPKKEVEKVGKVPHAFDDEFFPIRVRNNTKVYQNFDDEELYNKNEIEKGVNRLVHSLFETIVTEPTEYENDLGESLADLEDLVKEGLSIYKQGEAKNYANILNQGMDLVKTLNDLKILEDEAFLTFEDTNDDSFFQVCINFKGGKVCHNK